MLVVIGAVSSTVCSRVNMLHVQVINVNSTTKRAGVGVSSRGEACAGSHLNASLEAGVLC